MELCVICLRWRERRSLSRARRSAASARDGRPRRGAGCSDRTNRRCTPGNGSSRSALARMPAAAARRRRFPSRKVRADGGPGPAAAYRHRRSGHKGPAGACRHSHPAALVQLDATVTHVARAGRVIDAFVTRHGRPRRSRSHQKCAGRGRQEQSFLHVRASLFFSEGRGRSRIPASLP